MLELKVTLVIVFAIGFGMAYIIDAIQKKIEAGKEA